MNYALLLVLYKFSLHKDNMLTDEKQASAVFCNVLQLYFRVPNDEQFD